MRTVLKLSAVAIILSSVGTAGSAGMRPADESVARVSYRDLDLSREEGRAALAGRVSAAVHRVCDQDGDRSLEMQGAVARCRKAAALADAPQIAAAVAAGTRSATRVDGILIAGR